ncbi:MAG TPA: calcium-binding protein [Polyangiaceae bacterium]
MRNRLSFVPFSCLMLFSLAGCTASTSAPVISDDPFQKAEENLTPLAGTCTFVVSSGLMTVTATGTETAIISRRAADSAILQNGVSCDNLATSSTLKKLVINGTATGTTVILDFTNGLFGVGTSSTTSTGIAVNLTTSGTLGIRGTAAADKIAYGATGVNLNNDAFKDITMTNVSTHVVYLGDGADTFTAAGGTDIGGVFTSPITVYGGAGADVFNQGTVATPGEIIHGGADIDTVSYALRTAAMTVTVGAGANDGDGTATENDDINSDVEIVTGGTAADSMTAAPTVAVTFNGVLGDDTLIGDTGADVLNGDGGNDTLRGKAGADVLSGGDGNDTFDEEAASNGGDIFNGGAGIDTLDYHLRPTGGVTVTMDGIAANDGALVSGVSEGDNCKADVENILGSAFGDTITGNALNNTITGGDGDDILNGGAGDDTFLTGTVNDGLDTISGGTGVDTIDYSARLVGVTVTLNPASPSGAPAIVADPAATPPVVGVAAEADALAIDMENVVGTAQIDTITGNAAANELVGGAGVDNLNGNEGDDVLDGGGQADVLDCGTGDGDIGFNTTGTRTACEF